MPLHQHIARWVSPPTASPFNGVAFVAGATAKSAFGNSPQLGGGSAVARYRDIIASYPRERLGQLDLLNQEQLRNIRQGWPSLPGDYVDFLEEVGYGSLGDGCYMIYGGPIYAREVYSGQNDRLGAIVLAGDDFQGYGLGFDPDSSWALVEVDPNGGLQHLNQTFEDFVRKKIAVICK